MLYSVENTVSSGISTKLPIRAILVMFCGITSGRSPSFRVKYGDVASGIKLVVVVEHSRMESRGNFRCWRTSVITSSPVQMLIGFLTKFPSLSGDRAYPQKTWIFFGWPVKCGWRGTLMLKRQLLSLKPSNVLVLGLLWTSSAKYSKNVGFVSVTRKHSMMDSGTRERPDDDPTSHQGSIPDPLKLEAEDSCLCPIVNLRKVNRGL